MKTIQITITEPDTGIMQRYNRVAEVEDSGPLIKAIEAFLARKPRKSKQARTEGAK